MKIVQINATSHSGSTGKIVTGISSVLTKSGIENYIICANKESDDVNVYATSNYMEIKCNAFLSRITGTNGLDGKRSTRRIINILELIKPDVIHIHNIHNHFVNFEKLFLYIRKNKIKVIWTFHDCWAFTGYCVYFDYVKCSKWKSQCERCQQMNRYSWIFDKSGYMYKKKCDAVKDVDITITTPSVWLSHLVEQSFLNHYPCCVINNGIDLSVFRYRKSEFRKQMRIEEKKMILGVAFDWGFRKGLDSFIQLAKDLDDSFQIVLVGTNDVIDKQLPQNVISIHRTSNQVELAEIYSAADVFVNPTREENFPTVNIEALACGTPVITYTTGGSAEIIDDTCGVAISKDDFNSLKHVIETTCKDRPFLRENCEKRALLFDMNVRFHDYLDVYRKVNG